MNKENKNELKVANPRPFDDRLRELLENYAIRLGAINWAEDLNKAHTAILKIFEQEITAATEKADVNARIDELQYIDSEPARYIWYPDMADLEGDSLKWVAAEDIKKYITDRLKDLSDQLDKGKEIE